ncbi:hypothetical protein RN22_17360 [Grimontia sp. AD028]|nr:hypothetical protein RN22_17360 [Grimontia sp. AD028]
MDVWSYRLFNPAWVKQKRDSALLAIPKFGVEVEKRVDHSTAVFAFKPNMTLDLSPSHWLRKMKVEAKRVGRNSRLRGGVAKQSCLSSAYCPREKEHDKNYLSCCQT